MVDSAVDVVATALRPAGMVILESTTYPGTTEDRMAPRLAEATGLRAATSATWATCGSRPLRS